MAMGETRKGKTEAVWAQEDKYLSLKFIWER